MTNTLLDTTVLIDHLRGHAPARDWVASLDEVPACSELTRVEVVRGLRSPERARAETLFSALRWAPVTEEVTRLAGELGRQHRASHRHIGTVDLVIGATAIHLGAVLATSNLRHYPMFDDLEAPYERSG